MTSCITSTFSNTLTNPSLLLVFAVEADNGAMTISNSGTAEAWTDCGPGLVSDTVSINSIKCWYALNNQTTSSFTVTVSSGVATFSGQAVELTGAGAAIDAYSSITNVTGGAAGSNNLTANSLTSTYSGDMVLNFFTAHNVGPTVGTSPNLFMSIGLVGGQFLEYFLQGSAEAITPTASNSTSSDHYSNIGIVVKP